MDFSITNVAAIAGLNAVTALCDVGAGANAKLVIYGGTPPTRAKDPLSGNPVLVTLNMSATAFGAAVDSGSNSAEAVANPITTTPATTTGTATFCRVLDKNASVVQQGDVGANGSGAFLELNSTSLVQDVDVEVQNCVWGQPEQYIV